MGKKSVCDKAIEKIHSKKTRQQAEVIYNHFIKHQSTARLRVFVLARIISNKNLRELYYYKALEKESQNN